MSQSEYRQRMRDRRGLPDGGGVDTSFQPSKLGRVTIKQQQAMNQKKKKATEPPDIPPTGEELNLTNLPPIQQPTFEEEQVQQAEEARIKAEQEAQLAEEQRLTEEAAAQEQAEKEAATQTEGDDQVVTEQGSAEPDSYFQDTPKED